MPSNKMEEKKLFCKKKNLFFRIFEHLAISKHIISLFSTEWRQNTNELLWNGDVVGEYTWYAPDKCRSTTLEIIHECKCRIPELERILDSSDMNLSFDFLYGSKLYQVYLLDIFFTANHNIE